VTVPRGSHPWREPPLRRPDTRQGHRTEYPADFPVAAARLPAVPVRQSARGTDLLAAGLCSAACLLACEDGECACRCGGEFHGALTDAEVTIDPDAWHGKAVLRDAGTDPAETGMVTRRELRALPMGAPASSLRLRVAMLAWDCGPRDAAKRLGMDRTTYYRALRGDR
jgi:hypothetical protein